MITPAYHVPDVTAQLVAKALAQPRADTFIDQVLRFDTTTLVVDDPVKRVDNMAMAWKRACPSWTTSWWNWQRACRPS